VLKARGVLEAVCGVALTLVALQVPIAPVASTQPISAPVRVERPAGERAAALPDPVVSYRMEAGLDTERHRVQGEATILWRNTARVPQRELYLHLYLNAFKNERTVFMRSESASGFRGQSTLSDWGYLDVKSLRIPAWDAELWPPPVAHTPGDPQDETDIRVPLPREVAPGETIELEVSWTSQLPSVLLRTGFVDSFHMVAQWFPKLARLEPDGRWAHFPFQRLSEFYADYGDYEVWIDAPSDFVVGATGKRDAELSEGGRRRYKYVARGVHDFAFTAWDRFNEQSATIDDTAVRILFPPGLSESARIELQALRHALPYFERAFGEYPYDTLTVVHPPRWAAEAGGMEYPTLITTGGRWYGPRLGVRAIDAVTVHELGHQWFYGLVGSNENRWPFLDEGLTSYAEHRALEAAHPGASALDGLGLAVSLPALARAGAARVWANDRIAQPAAQFVSGGDYGRLVYARTSTLLHTVGRVWGEAQLEAAIGDYARTWRFRHPTPQALIAAVRGRLGRRAGEALHRGLFERGWVDLQVDGMWCERRRAAEGIFGSPDSLVTASGELQAGWEGGARIRQLGTLRFPVEVDLHGADGTIQRVRWDGDEVATVVRYRGDSELVAVIVDPERRVLLDQDLSNNAKRIAPRRVAGRLATRLMPALQLLWGVLDP